MAYEVVAAYDNNQVANTVYKHNFGLSPCAVNLEHLAADHFVKLAADCWLLSPPCQPFTRGGSGLDDRDERSRGLLHLTAVLAAMPDPPAFVFVENVLNFETSTCRDRLVAVLQERAYAVSEYLISPLDPAVAMPNDRLRYYLLATRGGEERSDREGRAVGEVIRALPGRSRRGQESGCRPIGDYLCTFDAPAAACIDGSEASFAVPLPYLADHATYRHDIVDATSRRSATFTKGYGSKYIVGTGSLLKVDPQRLLSPTATGAPANDRGLRFFTPSEIARLHAFPLQEAVASCRTVMLGAPADAASAACTTGCEARCQRRAVPFSFPKGVSVQQQYRLLGNSLNVRVVAHLLAHLLAPLDLDSAPATT